MGHPQINQTKGEKLSYMLFCLFPNRRYNTEIIFNNLFQLNIFKSAFENSHSMINVPFPVMIYNN